MRAFKRIVEGCFVARCFIRATRGSRNLLHGIVSSEDRLVAGSRRWLSALSGVCSFHFFCKIPVGPLLEAIKTLASRRRLAKRVQDALSAGFRMLHAWCGLPVSLDVPAIGTAVGESVLA